MNITELEKKLILAICDNEYNEGYNTGAWIWCAIGNAGLTMKEGRGVLSSLIKKKLATADTTGDSSMIDVKLSDTFTCILTEAGEEIYEELTGESCNDE
jgi:hypothetical protein